MQVHLRSRRADRRVFAMKRQASLCGLRLRRVGADHIESRTVIRFAFVADLSSYNFQTAANTQHIEDNPFNVLILRQCGLCYARKVDPEEEYERIHTNFISTS